MCMHFSSFKFTVSSPTIHFDSSSASSAIEATIRSPTYPCLMGSIFVRDPVRIGGSNRMTVEEDFFFYEIIRHMNSLRFEYIYQESIKKLSLLQPFHDCSNTYVFFLKMKAWWQIKQKQSDGPTRGFFTSLFIVE